MASEDASADRWWTEKTVAVVTGANKGIGLDIGRQLAEEGLTVVLLARDQERGLKATQELHAQGLTNVVFRQLDIASPTSVTEFVEWIKQTFGGLDILVNNASVLHHGNVYEHAVESVDINYYGTKNLTEQLLPFFKASPAGARIVILSSGVGALSYVSDEGVRQQLMDPTVFTSDTIDQVANKYKEVCRSGDPNAAAGYGDAYIFSKVLQNAYTRLLAQRLANRPEGSKVYVNCVNPGMVDTEMHARSRKILGEETFAKLQEQKLLPDTVRPISKGAETPVWLALHPAGGPSGKFWFDREEYSYVQGKAD